MLTVTSGEEMFVPALEGQRPRNKKEMVAASQKFANYWLCTIEIGDGSNVQGLETTASFDPQTDEFIIHSPTLTSSKVATHGIVYSRLIINGQFHGIHGFIVQLRSMDDQFPLPGITVGDMGPKFGHGAYNTMDNGVLRFDHVRIPRNQMLMSRKKD